MRKQERTSHKRRADEQGRQLDLFEPAHEDLEHVGDSRPHGQEPPERDHAVDLEGANEYGLGPAQLPLFEAMEPLQEGDGVGAADREDNAPREGEGDPASERQQDAQQEPRCP